MCNNKNEHFTFKKTWQSFHGSGFTRLSFVQGRKILLSSTCT